MLQFQTGTLFCGAVHNCPCGVMMDFCGAITDWSVIAPHGPKYAPSLVRICPKCDQNMPQILLKFIYVLFLSYLGEHTECIRIKKKKFLITFYSVCQQIFILTLVFSNCNNNFSFQLPFSNINKPMNIKYEPDLSTMHTQNIDMLPPAGLQDVNVSETQDHDEHSLAVSIW